MINRGKEDKKTMVRDRISAIIFWLLAECKITNPLPDEIFVKLLYQFGTGKKLNLENPRLFNEKIQWLKLYDREDEYTNLVDKYEVRDYVKKQIGEEHLIPLVGGPWNSFDEIDFSKLPNQYVLKCTHDSGGVYICTDKEKCNKRKMKRKIEKSLKRNYFYLGREWPYKNVKPRIIAEKYMVDESGIELKDYKIFCFSGEPKLIQVDFNRFSNHQRNVYSTNWEYLPIEIKYPTNSEHIIEKPKCLDEMLRIASVLSQGKKHVRVDLYCIGEKVYFGELTFHHGSGCEKITPPEFEKTMGDWIEIKKS